MWRLRFIAFAAGAFILLGLWVAYAEHTLTGLLAISMPVFVLLYIAAVAAANAYGPAAAPGDRQGNLPFVLGPRLGMGLSLSGCAWFVLVGGVFLWMGDWKFGLFGLSIAFVFLAVTLPGRLSTMKIAVTAAGLLVASVVFIL